MHRGTSRSPDSTFTGTGDQVRARVARDLETHGLKATSQRMRVAELLLKTPQHLTAEQILGTLAESGQRVSKATVYNTLKVLTEHGLVRQINLGGDHAVYDSTPTRHHHFHNLDTGELVDIGLEEIDFLKIPNPPEGTEAASVDVVIRIRQRESRG